MKGNNGELECYGVLRKIIIANLIDLDYACFLKPNLHPILLYLWNPIYVYNYLNGRTLVHVLYYFSNKYLI